MKLRRTMKAKSPKKKEIIIIIIIIIKEGDRDFVRPKDMQQEESTSRPYVCSNVCKNPLKI